MGLWQEWFMVWHEMEFSMMWEQEGKEMGEGGKGELGEGDSEEGAAEGAVGRRTRRSSAIEQTLQMEEGEGSGGEESGGEGADSSDDEEGGLGLGHLSMKVAVRGSTRIVSGGRAKAEESRKKAESYDSD